MAVVSADDLQRRRAEVSASPTLGALAERLRDELGPLLTGPIFLPEQKALLSRDGGVCAHDGSRLRFDPFSPHRHECPSCGEVFEGEMMVPVASGDQTIPSIDYIYFDPAEEKYVTISTAPIHISIEAEPEKVSVPNIFAIKSVPGSLKQAPDYTTSRPAYWLVWGVPLLLLVGAQVWRRQSNKRAEVNRAMRASREARRHLSRARRNEADVYGAVEHALTTYITDRLGRPVSGLTLPDLIGLLDSRGVDSEVVERVRMSITASEAGRFSPETVGPGPNSRDLLNEAELLISDLEREMSR